VKEAIPLPPSDVIALLSKLCIGLGFCLPQEKQLSIASAAFNDIDEFTKAVFLAEGLDPTTSGRQLYRQVRQEVALAFVQYQQRQNVREP
jgi:hypothetical protein